MCLDLNQGYLNFNQTLQTTVPNNHQKPWSSNTMLFGPNMALAEPLVGNVYFCSMPFNQILQEPYPGTLGLDITRHVGIFVHLRH